MIQEPIEAMEPVLRALRRAGRATPPGGKAGREDARLRTTRGYYPKPGNPGRPTGALTRIMHEFIYYEAKLPAL